MTEKLDMLRAFVLCAFEEEIITETDLTDMLELAEIYCNLNLEPNFI